MDAKTFLTMTCPSCATGMGSWHNSRSWCEILPSGCERRRMQRFMSWSFLEEDDDILYLIEGRKEVWY